MGCLDTRIMSLYNLYFSSSFLSYFYHQACDDRGDQGQTIVIWYTIVLKATSICPKASDWVDVLKTNHA
jgi:hypothetical protein